LREEHQPQHDRRDRLHLRLLLTLFDAEL